MSFVAKPMNMGEFETLRNRVLQNRDTLVDPEVVLRLIATVELLEGLRRMHNAASGIVEARA